MSTRSLSALLGRRVLGWLALGVGAGASLGLVELALATVLLLFLESLGLSPFTAARPSWAPVPTATSTALVLLTSLALARSLAHYVVSQAGAEAQSGLDLRLRRFSIERLLAPSAVSPDAAELHRQLADVFPKAGAAASQMSAFTASSVQALVLAVLMLAARPFESIVGLVGLAIVGALVLRLHRSVRTLAEDVPREQRTLYRGIERVARNFVLVHVLGTVGEERRRLTLAVDGHAQRTRRASRLVSLAYAATPLFGTLLLALVVGFSHAPLEGVRLIAFVYLYVRFVQTMAVVARTFTGTAQSWPQLREAAALAHGMSPEGRARSLSAVADGPPTRVTRHSAAPPAIAIEGLSFRHPGAARDALSEVSVRVGAGEQLGVVGPSGAGKTTLVLVVLGFLEPSAGEVRIDGVPAREHWARGRAGVGFVGAEPYLIAGTLRDNLGYGLGAPPDDDAMWSALAAVELESLVRSRSLGLDFVLDENGTGLSAGEQQRLSLARALLASPTLLILDEVSANLDAALEAEIASVVHGLRGRCTTIVVSHRPAMLAHADATLDLGSR